MDDHFKIMLSKFLGSSDEFDKVSSFDNSIDYIYSEIKLIRKICDKMENELINLKIEQEKKK